MKTDLQLIHLAAGYTGKHPRATYFLPGPEQTKHLDPSIQQSWLRSASKGMVQPVPVLYTVVSGGAVLPASPDTRCTLRGPLCGSA